MISDKRARQRAERETEELRLYVKSELVLLYREMSITNMLLRDEKINNLISDLSHICKGTYYIQSTRWTNALVGDSCNKAIDNLVRAFLMRADNGDYLDELNWAIDRMEWISHNTLND